MGYFAFLARLLSQSNNPYLTDRLDLVPGIDIAIQRGHDEWSALVSSHPEEYSDKCFPPNQCSDGKSTLIMLLLIYTRRLGVGEDNRHSIQR
jgi:hypothetical protein